MAIINNFAQKCRRLALFIFPVFPYVNGSIWNIYRLVVVDFIVKRRCAQHEHVSEENCQFPSMRYEIHVQIGFNSKINFLFSKLYTPCTQMSLI